MPPGSHYITYHPEVPPAPPATNSSTINMVPLRGTLAGGATGGGGASTGLDSTFVGLDITAAMAQAASWAGLSIGGWGGGVCVPRCGLGCRGGRAAGVG